MRSRDFTTFIILFVLLVGVAVISATQRSAEDPRAERNIPGSLFTGFIPRTQVDLAPGGRFQRPADGIDCASDSPIAALAKLTNGNWAGKVIDGKVAVTRITTDTDLARPGISPLAPKSYTAYTAGRPETDLCESYTDPDEAGTETLFYVQCNGTGGGAPTGCYRDSPVQLQYNNDRYAVGPVLIPQYRQDFYAYNAGGTITAMVVGAVQTDEGYQTQTDQKKQDGHAVVSFTNPGPHTVVAVAGNGPPDRIPVCVTDGTDGYCGSPRAVPNDIPPPPPAPCATNGRDGLCGTIDTSGPVVTISNIKHKQVFKKSKAPGRIAGRIDIANDPNGLGTLRARIMRQTTAKVLIKPKKKTKKKQKKRYKKVKRCYTWDDETALLERSRSCTASKAKWFSIIPEELRDSFDYSFALKLPPGTYTLEVEATDENKFKDLKQVGRNIITFTVATR
ncbi:MAG: hypothetical protein HZB46_06300 [Solirubrobacterales bacterium]|nr:hypothetical protein [Solirubrobacterales bacterium]